MLQQLTVIQTIFWNLFVSLAAYSVTEDHQYEQDCIARVDFVSESESNDPEAYIGVYQPLDESEKGESYSIWNGCLST